MSLRPSALITWFLSFSFVGALVVSLIAPNSIGWYIEPPVEIGVNCRPSAEWAMNTLLKFQLVGVAIGMLLGGVIIYILLKRDKNKKRI